jgi:hypothetical protein
MLARRTPPILPLPPRVRFVHACLMPEVASPISTTWSPISAGPSIGANVGWKWKAGEYRLRTGCSTYKSSLREAISVRLHPPTTKFGGM